MPGALTIILDKNEKVSDILTAGLDTIGVRIPKNNISLRILENVSYPLATTSANISGDSAGIKITDFLKEFDGVVDAIIDGGETVSDKLVALTAKIGEKLSFRRFEKVTKADDETFGTYIHLGGKIGTIVVVKGANEEVAKDVAMQAAAMSPVALKRDGVPAEMVEHEKGVITEQVKNEAAGKPEDIVARMVNGRLEKFYKEIVLEEQAFIKENKLSVSKYVSDNGGEIKSMVRFAVGEGIEKRQENFAEEVMSQINDAAK